MGYTLQREKWQIIIGKISVGHWLLQVAKCGHNYTLCVQGQYCPKRFGQK